MDDLLLAASCVVDPSAEDMRADWVFPAIRCDVVEAIPYGGLAMQMYAADDEARVPWLAVTPSQGSEALTCSLYIY